MTTIVKVAKYRDEIDHLLRIVNVDYHACVGVREVESWKETAGRILTQVEDLRCERANARDRDQHAKAIAAARARLVDADARIAQLHDKRQVVGPPNNSRSAAPMTRCADCGKETPLDGLAKSLFQCDGLSERLDPGSEVPGGECECGAFAYLIPSADRQLAAIEIARYVHDLVSDGFFADDELPNIEWLKATLRAVGMPVSQEQ